MYVLGVYTGIRVCTRLILILRMHGLHNQRDNRKIFSLAFRLDYSHVSIYKPWIMSVYTQPSSSIVKLSINHNKVAEGRRGESQDFKKILNCSCRNGSMVKSGPS